MSRLIATNLDNLKELASFLADEVVERTVDNKLTPSGKACKEALLSSQVLIGKLEALVIANLGNGRQLQFGECEICD